MTASRFSALIFKIMTDPFVGQLCFLRVYSGKLSTGDTVLNATKNKKERIGRLVKMHANKREEIQEILAGDICAAVGLKTAGTGDTICADRRAGGARIDRLPDARHSARDRAEDEGGPGKARRRDQQAGQRRSDVEGLDRSRNRPDDSRRHGRAAPGNHRRPHEARVQRGGERRQAAGRLSRDDSQHRRIRVHAQEADRRQRSVRQGEAARRADPRTRTSSSRTKSTAARFRRNSSPPSKRAWPRRSKAASWPATR